MKSIKRTVSKKMAKSFITMAEIFSTLGCQGRSYEPKMPERLKK